MRIGFDAKRYFHNQTGLGNYARTLVNGLIEAYEEHQYVLFDAAPTAAHPTKAEVVKKPVYRPFWRQFAISKDIQRNHLDVYHGLSAELPYTRPKKTSMVVTIHDLIFMKYPQYYKAVDRFIYAHKLDNALRSADAVIATSEQTKRDLLDIMPDDDIPIHVIYQNCDAQFYQTQSEDSLQSIRHQYSLPTTFMLMVSKFEQRKNHLSLLKAFVQKSDHLPPLVLVGKKGDTYNDVSAFIEQHRLSEKVTVLTDVPTKDLPGLYQLANFSVFPSLYEGFGIPVLESLACETPVLTSDQSCMQEIVGSAGLYFEPNQPDSILDALERATDQQVVEQLRAEISSRTSLFSNDIILADHIQLYTQLCSK